MNNPCQCGCGMQANKPYRFVRGHYARVQKNCFGSKDGTPWNKGLKTGPRSQETKDKISASNTGKKRTQEVIDAHSKRHKKWIEENGHPMLGRKQSKESIEKIRMSRIGIKSTRKGMSFM